MEDPACKLEVARRNLLQKVTELEAKMSKIKIAEKRLSKKVKKSLLDPTKAVDPFHQSSISSSSITTITTSITILDKN